MWYVGEEEMYTQGFGGEQAGANLGLGRLGSCLGR